jgi:hypothetical protein
VDLAGLDAKRTARPLSADAVAFADVRFELAAALLRRLYGCGDGCTVGVRRGPTA